MVLAPAEAVLEEALDVLLVKDMVLAVLVHRVKDILAEMHNHQHHHLTMAVAVAAQAHLVEIVLVHQQAATAVTVLLHHIREHQQHMLAVAEEMVHHMVAAVQAVAVLAQQVQVVTVHREVLTQEAVAALVIKDMVTEVKVLLSFVTLVAKVLRVEHIHHQAVILSIPSLVMALSALTQQTIKLIDTHQKV